MLLNRFPRARWACASVFIAALAWTAIHMSHLIWPNAWLPVVGHEPYYREHLEQVDPHLYDAQWFDAARAGRLDITQALIDAGFPVNTQSGAGYTALVLATYHGHLDEVSALLRAHADPCIADTNGNTALMGALFKGEAVVAQQLLALCPIDQANNDGQTALAFAALFGRLEMIPALIKLGADPEHLDRQGKNPLRIVQDQGNEQAMAALQPYGRDRAPALR